MVESEVLRGKYSDEALSIASLGEGVYSLG